MENKVIPDSFRWSYSSITEFDKCPYSFYRNYILKDRRPLPNTFFGLALHEYIKDYSKQKIRPDEAIYYHKYKVKSQERGDFSLSVENINDFLTKNVFPYRYQTEREVTFQIGPYTIKSVYDKVLHFPQRIRVYDWKTSREAKETEAYNIQLSLYRLSLSKEHPGKQIETILYYPRIDKTLEIVSKYSEEFFIDKLNKLQCTTSFEPSPNEFCRYCPYQKKECPIYN